MNILRDLASIIGTTLGILLTAWTVGALAGVIVLGFRMVAG